MNFLDKPIQNTYTYKESFKSTLSSDFSLLVLQEWLLHASFPWFFLPESDGRVSTAVLAAHVLCDWPSLMAKTQTHKGTHNHVLIASSDFYSPPQMSAFIYSSESSGSCFIHFVQNLLPGWEMAYRKLILIS